MKTYCDVMAPHILSLASSFKRVSSQTAGLFFSVITGEDPGCISDSGEKSNISVPNKNEWQSGKLRKYPLLRREYSHILKQATAGKGET
jgi:hypothetical protein